MEKLNEILKSHIVALDEGEVKDKLLGAGFVVVDKKGTIFSGAAGRQGFETSSAAYTTDSIQWIASMTKLVTATCLLQLVEKGVLTLEEDLRAKVPELASMQILNGFDKDDRPILVDNTHPITLRHLLTHTAGTNYDLADPDLMKWSAGIGRTANSLSWSIDGFWAPLKFVPGSAWVYGPAYDWAGLTLQVVTGQKLSEYMAEHIFDPLGMTSTTFHPETIPDISARTVDWAVASESDPNRLEAGQSNLPKAPPFNSGGAGLFGTTADYGKFLAAMVQGKLLSPESYDTLFSPQLTDVQRESMMATVSAMWAFWAPEVPVDTPLDHGLGGMINLKDSPGRRPAGSLMWSGMSNGRWWIDRKTGVAAVMTMQLQPFSHPLAIGLYADLEKAVYGDLLPALEKK